MTGPTMLVPKASDSGALPRWISSLKIESFTGLQPVPPHSFGQCGTDQPLARRMRVHDDDVVLARMAAGGDFLANGSGQVFGDEIAHFVAKRQFFRGETEVHRLLPDAELVLI